MYHHCPLQHCQQRSPTCPLTRVMIGKRPVDDNFWLSFGWSKPKIKCYGLSAGCKQYIVGMHHDCPSQRCQQRSPTCPLTQLMIEKRPVDDIFGLSLGSKHSLQVKSKIFAIICRMQTIHRWNAPRLPFPTLSTALPYLSPNSTYDWKTAGRRYFRT